MLAILRGHATPWPLNWLYMDAEHCGRRDDFLRGDDARWPRWATHDQDRVLVAAGLNTLLLAGWCAVQLFYVGGALLYGTGGDIARPARLPAGWGVFALALTLYARDMWPRRRGRFAEYCRTLPPHPAKAALNDEQRSQLLRAMSYSPPEQEAFVRLDVDTPGAF
ncbi:hypothetical protein [Streptomyces sp. ALI-76-A]|uniref:hypothetical protein n=1 Tax=Streptomyces sp. ALI-76-A TaxID=3025736 RepID=UPI00256F4EEB|nr:hypothetical protein [Streptomyces sp. ALI-76-A]MDL5198865.1 hypothetical protein [Streptomyces sp. ALI-76-A]